MTSVSGIHCSGRGVVVGAPRLPEGEADREPADPDSPSIRRAVDARIVALSWV